jgi:hypothetical protein
MVMITKTITTSRGFAIPAGPHRATWRGSPDRRTASIPDRLAFRAVAGVGFSEAAKLISARLALKPAGVEFIAEKKLCSEYVSWIGLPYSNTCVSWSNNNPTAGS